MVSAHFSEGWTFQDGPGLLKELGAFSYVERVQLGLRYVISAIYRLIVLFSVGGSIFYLNKLGEHREQSDFSQRNVHIPRLSQHFSRFISVTFRAYSADELQARPSLRSRLVALSTRILSLCTRE